MQEITKDNFEREVLNSKHVVLIDFWASWCVPCKIISPIIEDLEKELKDKVKIGKSNVDEEPELATEMSVLNIPTLILFKDGKETGRIIGINSKEAILAKIKKVVGEE